MSAAPQAQLVHDSRKRFPPQGGQFYDFLHALDIELLGLIAERLQFLTLSCQKSFLCFEFLAQVA